MSLKIRDGLAAHEQVAIVAGGEEKVPPPTILVSPITKCRRTAGQRYSTRIQVCRSTGERR